MHPCWANLILETSSQIQDVAKSKIYPYSVHMYYTGKPHSRIFKTREKPMFAEFTAKRGTKESRISHVVFMKWRTWDTRIDVYFNFIAAVIKSHQYVVDGGENHNIIVLFSSVIHVERLDFIALSYNELPTAIIPQLIRKTLYRFFQRGFFSTVSGCCQDNLSQIADGVFSGKLSGHGK
jgi:hypothetical protein